MRKKITLSKSHRYLFNHFLRTYKQAIQSLQLREYLSSAEILSILDYLGYVD